MINLHLDADRFPAVAHGGASWSREEASHLERCAECRREWEIVRAARRLGGSAGDGVDPQRMASIVSRRLANEPLAPLVVPARAGRWALGLAAAAAIVFAVVIPRDDGRKPDGGSVATIAVLHELDGLTEAQLEAVLETIPPTADSAVHVDLAPFDELTAKDLERVLQSME